VYRGLNSPSDTLQVHASECRLDLDVLGSVFTAVGERDAERPVDVGSQLGVGGVEPPGQLAQGGERGEDLGFAERLGHVWRVVDHRLGGI
jgi:hypothetical protein